MILSQQLETHINYAKSIPNNQILEKALYLSDYKILLIEQLMPSVPF